ncbi:hypothetical protein [Bacillus sp. JJ1764]
MEKDKKTLENLSYESDGKMGKNNTKSKANEKEQANFFNTTQNSE